MKTESQNQLIINHLQKHGSITCWEAITKYRITRLSARIFDLKEKGYGIVTFTESKKDTKWARYVLVKGKKVF